MAKCEERVDAQMAARLGDLRRLLNGEGSEDLGRLEDYALSFDYVKAGTFDDQLEGYWRYQISWGGPSDEFRFFFHPRTYRFRAEYWFLDWFDGAHRNCTGELTVLRLWHWLVASGAVALTAERTRH